MSEDQHEERQENRHEEQHASDKLKLTKFDIVLETGIVLILLAMWGMVLVSLFCPAGFPGFYDQGHVVGSTIVFSLWTALAYWRTRYLMYSWNDKDNTELPARSSIMSYRVVLIMFGLIYLSDGLPGRWDDLFFYGLMCVFLLVGICDWNLKRKQNRA